MNGAEYQVPCSYKRNPKQHPVPYETIPERLRQLAEAKGNQNAFIFKENTRQTLTYREVYEKSRDFARGLLSLGTREGDIVAIGNSNSPEWLFATFGTQMVRGIPLHIPFFSRDGSDEVKIINSIGNCCVLVFSCGKEDQLWKALQSIVDTFDKNGQVTSKKVPSMRWVITMDRLKTEKDCLTIQDFIKTGSGLEKELPSLDPDFPAAIFLTSGSTGISKAIPHSHHSLLIQGWFFDIALQTIGKDSCVYYNDKPFTWQAGYPTWIFSNGGTLVTTNSFYEHASIETLSEKVLEIMESEQCTYALLLTAVVQKLIEMEKTPRRLHVVSVAGQPIPKSITNKAVEKLCDLFVVFYGSSECSAIAYEIVTADKPNNKDFNCGFPFPGVEVKIADKDENIVPYGATGEVYVKSVVPFMGYLNNPQNCTTKFGWYKTGDCGHFNKDGKLIVEGRMSDVIVIGEGLVAPRTIEDFVKEHPCVTDCCVFPVRDEITFQKACAAIDIVPGKSLTNEEINDFLTTQMNVEDSGFYLKRQFIPAYYIFFHGFPKLYNGKINRKVIIAKSLENLEKSTR